MSFQPALRELQWMLPLWVQSAVLRATRAYDPFSNWTREHRAIFIHVPRTGGTSIARASGAPKPHIPISRYAAVDRSAFESFFKFAVVRNPWDRMLSAYSCMRLEAQRRTNWKEGRVWAREHILKYDSFESFVLALLDPAVRRTIIRHSHFRPQVDWLAMPYSRHVSVDFLGRFERLEEDYANVARKIGIDPTLPNVNGSDHEPYHHAYSQQMRDIVGQLYEEEIALFGYAF